MINNFSQGNFFYIHGQVDLHSSGTDCIFITKTYYFLAQPCITGMQLYKRTLQTNQVEVSLVCCAIHQASIPFTMQIGKGDKEELLSNHVFLFTLAGTFVLSPSCCCQLRTFILIQQLISKQSAHKISKGTGPLTVEFSQIYCLSKMNQLSVNFLLGYFTINIGVLGNI